MADHKERLLLGELPADADPRLLQLHAYWESIKPSPELLPGRQHFDPVDIPGLLPFVWVLDIHRTPLRFSYRLIGTECSRVMERDPTGQWLDELPGVVQPSQSYAQFMAVADAGTIAYRDGQPHFHTVKFVVWLERLLLPLARDGVKPDMILAITVFGIKNIPNANTVPAMPLKI